LHILAIFLPYSYHILTVPYYTKTTNESTEDIQVARLAGWSSQASQLLPAIASNGNPNMKRGITGMFTTKYGFTLNIAEQILNEVELLRLKIGI
jgi:hypothetical protein